MRCDRPLIVSTCILLQHLIQNAPGSIYYGLVGRITRTTVIPHSTHAPRTQPFCVRYFYYFSLVCRCAHRKWHRWFHIATHRPASLLLYVMHERKNAVHRNIEAQFTEARTKEHTYGVSSMTLVSQYQLRSSPGPSCVHVAHNSQSAVRGKASWGHPHGALLCG